MDPIIDSIKNAHDITVELSQRIIVQHNDLIQQQRYKINKGAGQSLSLLEKKIILYVISEVKSTDTMFNPFVFEFKDFCDACGIRSAGGDYYKHLKDVITSIASKVLWLERPDDTEVIVRWIDKAIVDKKNKTITITLDRDLEPYLLYLKGNFTQFPLLDIIKMRSKYGIALYEIIKSYLYQGNRMQFSLDDLKERLDCTSYTIFGNLKAKVIEPAIEEINKLTELSVDVEYKKTGKSYTDVIFTVYSLNYLE